MRVAQSARWSRKSRSPTSAQCRSSKTSTSGPTLPERLEEAPPGGERLLPPLARGRFQRDERAQVAFHPVCLCRVGHELANGPAELRVHGVRAVALEDPRLGS